MKKKKKIQTIRSRMIYLTAFLTLLLIVVSSIIIYGVGNVLCRSESPEKVNLYKSHGLKNLESVDIFISIKGIELTIPSDIGIGENLLRPLHTDDEPGRVYIESKCKRDFLLGDFFKVWGKRFNKNCVLDYCDNANHTLKMLVNGEESTAFENLVLEDGQEISIIYS